MTVNIGIVGSRLYTDEKKVEQVVDKCIEKYGANYICIISGGAIGADTLGKIVALKKKLKYIEYNPAHTDYNEYSGKPKEYYGKSYNVKYYFERNSFIAEDSHMLFAFIPKGIQCNGTMDTVNKVKKLNKPYFILN
jgi:predicted Rossmann-fold nucleotide-binding protein